MTEHLAAYGTLKQSSGQQQDLGVAHMLRFVGPCTLPGRLINLGAYPALVKGEGRVEAELFQVLNPAVWPILDAYEGDEYTRIKIQLLAPPIYAWTYFHADPAAEDLS